MLGALALKARGRGSVPRSAGPPLQPGAPLMHDPAIPERLHTLPAGGDTDFAGNSKLIDIHVVHEYESCRALLSAIKCCEVFERSKFTAGSYRNSGQIRKLAAVLEASAYHKSSEDTRLRTTCQVNY